MKFILIYVERNQNYIAARLFYTVLFFIETILHYHNIYKL